MFVPDTIRRCVIFIGLQSVRTGTFTPKATAFFVQGGEGDFAASYIVTAEHVVTHLHARAEEINRSNEDSVELAIRVNRHDGKSDSISLRSARWLSHPDAKNPTDVAITPFSINYGVMAQFALPLFPALLDTSTKEHLRKKGAGLGQEIAIIGLFRHHVGDKTNIPIVRVGNISAMPDEPVWTRYCGYTEAFLVEARSISGLSGSPVFINLTDAQPNLRHEANMFAQLDNIVDFSRYQFLGLMHGHWDLPNLTDDSAVEDDDDQKDKREGINTGIGVVIPVQKVLETLYQQELVEERMALQKK